jgi:hypothetical protein
VVARVRRRRRRRRLEDARRDTESVTGVAVLVAVPCNTVTFFPEDEAMKEMRVSSAEVLAVL